MEQVVDNEVTWALQEKAGFSWASVIYKLREDLAEAGAIRPETWRQVLAEEQSYVAEAIDGPQVTDFEIDYDPALGLIDQRGEGLRESYIAKYQTVKGAAETDPRLDFYAHRLELDVSAVLELEAMLAGELDGDSLVDWSPFPQEAYRAEGRQFLEALGYQPERLMGFIRLCKIVAPGRVRLTSIVIDNSDLEAFRAVAEVVGLSIPPEAGSDDFPAYRARLSDPAGHIDKDYLLAPYDQKMAERYGGEFRAGRPVKAEEVEVFDFVRRQSDLQAAYMAKLEDLARGPLTGQPLAAAKIRLTASYWAAAKDRYQGGGQLTDQPADGRFDQGYVEQEMATALQAAEARYETMVGCGGGWQLGQPEKLLENSPESILRFIFGRGFERSWLWKDGFCVVKGCESHKPKPKKVKVGPCSVCKHCQAKDDLKRFLTLKK